MGKAAAITHKITLSKDDWIDWFVFLARRIHHSREQLIELEKIRTIFTDDFSDHLVDNAKKTYKRKKVKRKKR
jgi:hypothetical protein